MTTRKNRLNLDAIDQEGPVKQAPAVGEVPAKGSEAPAKKGARTPAAAPLARPVRLSVDLGPMLYYWIIEHCIIMGRRMGRTKVPHVEVMRALVAELKSDKELQAKIDERVRTALAK